MNVTGVRLAFALSLLGLVTVPTVGGCSADMTSHPAQLGDCAIDGGCDKPSTSSGASPAAARDGSAGTDGGTTAADGGATAADASADATATATATDAAVIADAGGTGTVDP